MLKKITFAALALIISGSAFAGEKNLYKNLDANNDGAISQTEAAALPVLKEQWKALDANADGSLDKAEFAKFEMMSK